MRLECWDWMWCWLWKLVCLAGSLWSLLSWLDDGCATQEAAERLQVWSSYPTCLHVRLFPTAMCQISSIITPVLRKAPEVGCICQLRDGRHQEVGCGSASSKARWRAAVFAAIGTITSQRGCLQTM